MNPLLEKALWSAGGAFIALVGAYFSLGKSISNQLAYCQGSLAMIHQQLQLLQKLKDSLIDLTKDSIKLKVDLDHAHAKIRDLQRRMENGAAEHDA